MISSAKRFLLFLVAFLGALFLFNAAPASAQITCPYTLPATPTDEDVLRAFYCATDGPNWTDSTGWGTAAFSSDNWRGTFVNSSGRVTTLCPSQNNLTGKIPAYLNNLTSLTQLCLDRNNLTGDIPDLSALTGLTQLYLNGNRLTGTIPASLNTLTSLTHLYLGKNELTGDIPDLSALTSLTQLTLNENHLTGTIPSYLNTLTGITYLQLQHNQLSGEIPDLSALDSLTDLGLQRNKLSGQIPASLGDLDSLTGLWLGNNQLSGDIPDLSALADSLTGFAFQHNKLSGDIPASLNTLTRLTYLRLNHNQLSGEIPDLSALTGLTYLRLSNNRLTGGIPDLSALTNLRDLLLDNNQLSGEIPTAQLEALANLEDLGLWGNEGLTWDGDISNRLRERIERAALQTFYTETRYDVRGRTSWISRDGWSDSARKFSFGSWVGITTDNNGWVRRINLSSHGLNNSLTGNFPNAFEALAGLEHLNLSYNTDLIGPLPLGLMDLPVTALDIRCTGVGVPANTGFRNWLAGIAFRSGCPPLSGINLSVSPDPVPWDGTGAITVESPAAFEDVVVEITADGLCVWDDTRSNQVPVNIPGGIRSEKEVGFNLVRNEDYYNGGESCPEENKEDCKKCFFTWYASWATDGGRTDPSQGNTIVLSILPPSGSGPPTGGVPPTGGGPSPTGGGPSPGGGGSPPGGPSDPTPDSDTPARCGESDREYLERFYEATGGDAWHRDENWNSQEPLGEWFGVETDEDGEVVSLRLAGNGLSGDMPTEELLCLNENTELKELALWDNDLSGDVPEGLELAVERAALRYIAEMLNISPEWFENYEDPFDFEDWYEGVTTDDDGRVVELDLPGEIPESIRSQFKERREITITTSDGGCALSPEGSSAFSLFLLTLFVFAVLVRKRAR